MRTLFILLIGITVMSCSKNYRLGIDRSSNMTGSAFYKQAWSYNWQRRDSLAAQLLRAGDMPAFLQKFSRVDVSLTDSSTGKHINAYYFVSPDYLSVGTDADWARIPLTPITAQKLADEWNCFLPTRKMVNDIYTAAKVKLEPVPMYIYRDSTVTMWQHHLIIEGQRKDKKGLIAGIKKDVVITDKLTRDPKKNRVAIYGWHKLDGKAIQPVYTGHVDWYVDYSHGIRLVHQTVYVEGKAMNYKDVMRDPILRRLLCDEENCDVVRYDY